MNSLAYTKNNHFCALKPISMIIMAINNIFGVFIGHYLHQSQDYFNNFHLHESDIALSLVRTCSLIQSATANIICSNGMGTRNNTCIPFPL